MDMGIPPLELKIPLESNPLKSRISARRLAVPVLQPKNSFAGVPKNEKRECGKAELCVVCGFPVFSREITKISTEFHQNLEHLKKGDNHNSAFPQARGSQASRDDLAAVRQLGPALAAGMYIYIYIYIYIYVYTYLLIFVYLFINLSIHLFIHLSIYIYIYIYRERERYCFIHCFMYLCVVLYVLTYTIYIYHKYTHIYIYIYICICIYMYIHMYIQYIGAHALPHKGADSHVWGEGPWWRDPECERICQAARR